MNLRSTWVRFNDLVVTMEERPWGPVHVFGILAAVIVIRNILEIGVAQNPVFPGLAAFTHYPLAYLGPFLSLSLVLAFWGRVAPARVHAAEGTLHGGSGRIRRGHSRDGLRKQHRSEKALAARNGNHRGRSGADERLENTKE